MKSNKQKTAGSTNPAPNSQPAVDTTAETPAVAPAISETEAISAVVTAAVTTAIAAIDQIQHPQTVPAPSAEPAEPSKTPAQLAREQRAAQMRVNKPVDAQPEAEPSGEAEKPAKKPATPRAPRPKKDAFSVDLALRTELRALTGEELVARAVEKKLLGLVCSVVLERGEEVKVPRFGRFYAKRQRAKLISNPGDRSTSIRLPAQETLGLKASSRLRTRFDV
jgi:nucleoid DNA-binding protein